jgi:hypothetical protein
MPHEPVFDEACACAARRETYTYPNMESFLSSFFYRAPDSLPLTGRIARIFPDRKADHALGHRRCQQLSAKTRLW